MAKLTPARRAKMPAKDFAGGGPKGKKGFPMNDATHDRMAISGATRSYNAGNISKGKEESVKSEARSKLGESGSRGSGGGGRGKVPRGEAHQDNHREPRTHEEFHQLGNPGKDGEYC